MARTYTASRTNVQVRAHSTCTSYQHCPLILCSNNPLVGDTASILSIFIFWTRAQVSGDDSRVEETKQLKADNMRVRLSAEALLEYRARCTSARFWIQSELLDLRVGCCAPQSASAGSDSRQAPPGAGAPGSYGDRSNVSDPGVVGDLPSLMRSHLTCPLLSKLLQQDPVLSGKLATLDHVLWHRRSKHEPQTFGWMSHDAHCPEGCSFGAPQGAPEALTAVRTPGGCVNSNGSSCTSTMDSMMGSDGTPAGTFSSLGAPAESTQPARAAEDESRPVTAWVSCEQCMEHFAYIAASLLVFLKPSELRDLAVERQQSHCCGFVFCGRRNVATPEK